MELVPTAQQDEVPGTQETARSTGTSFGSVSAVQSEPLLVETAVVVGPAGSFGATSGVIVVPTASHAMAAAHETLRSGPVPAGAVCRDQVASPDPDPDKITAWPSAVPFASTSWSPTAEQLVITGQETALR